ncbi:MAG: type I toxin-antitoxin system SymE family toxin [Candidatus Thiodiazotropha sp. (ex Notomyrtea botanica)]|nr:type I toxin-antitoxin system SymE family toxin [Candidatus Thiodiazotropha sp. (ex Notomyrtea botanica)]
MNKEFRELKVVRHFSHKSVASLPLKGRWLEEAGFKVGSQVNVIVRKGCLVILASGASEG